MRVPVQLSDRLAREVQAATPAPEAAAAEAPAEPVELLAPAGSYEALVAAVENGADAVYLGGEAFNARKFAANFSDDELRRGIDFAHVRGVKVFVVVNTLIFNHEFAEAVAFLEKVARFGADAVIVQDLGVMKAARELTPDLPVHISTQATVHNSKGVEFLNGLGATVETEGAEADGDASPWGDPAKAPPMAQMADLEAAGNGSEQEKIGAERVILAREMRLKDIAGMKGKTGAELETFVHGALCYCYSGQCLMSSLIGGRSGNRGACAYTCRLPFNMEADGATMPEVREKHVLSSKDLNTLERIPDLIEAGVTSFKIEGRMKRPEYVATVVGAYRRAIDRHYAGDFHVTEEEKQRVLNVFNREFTEGFLDGKEKWAYTSWDTAGNRGVPVGEVVASGKGWVKVRLTAPLQVKDGISILHDPKAWHEGARSGGAPEEYGFTVNQMLQDGHYVKEAAPGEVVELRGEQWSRPGDPVFKTADFETLEAARRSYGDGVRRKVPVALEARVEVGAPLEVTLRDPARGVDATHVSDFEVQPARKAPLTEAAAREQLERLGETPFEAARVDVRLDGNAFVPISVLNGARREAAAKLEQALASRYHRPPRPGFDAAREAFLSFPEVERSAAPRVSAKCWTLDAVEAALRGGADVVYFSGLRVGGLQPKWDLDALEAAARLAADAGAPLYLDSGMVQKDWEVDFLAKALDHLGDGVAGVLAGNHGAFQVARERGVDVVADWPMNVYNSVTSEFLRAKGASRITLHPELTLEDIAGITTHAPRAVGFEAIVHGRHTLMTSEYCSIGHATACQLEGGTWAPCHDTKYALRDEGGYRFPLETDGACRMYILNSKELCMLDRLDAVAAAGAEVLRVETIGTRPDAVEAQVRAYKRAAERLFDDPDRYQVDREDFAALKRLCPDGFTTGHYYRGPL